MERNEDIFHGLIEIGKEHGFEVEVIGQDVIRGELEREKAGSGEG